MDGGSLKFGFLHNHSVIVNRLSTSSILADVYAAGIVSNTEKEVISKQLAESQKTDKLLDIIHRQGIANSKVYCTFFELLSNVTSGQNFGSVLEQIKADSTSEEVRQKFQYERWLLEESDREVMIKFKSVIMTSLSVEDVLPELVSTGIVSSMEKVDIQSNASQDAQALVLYSIILDRGSHAFKAFVRILLESDKYKHLGSQLQSHSDHTDKSPDVVFDKYPVEEVLRRGLVPPRQGVYVERERVTRTIREALYHLKDEEGWVIVHGMAGFGKTVLAAEAVRDAAILQDVFPGGVNWLTVGKLTDRHGDINRGKLLSKLQTLVLRLDTSNSNCQLPSVEATKNYLQKVIAEQYPRSLLILDDVWSYEVIITFDVRCRVLVTSRVAGLVSPVLVKNVHSVSVSDGFTLEEGKLLLAQWLGKPPEELSPYSGEVLEYCRGSPMAIALIGGMLRKNSSARKWKAIADKMEHKHLYLSTRISNWSYEHPTLNASIELSVESLPEELKEYFQMLTVFDYDLPISPKVLCTIWNVDELDAEEYINVITDYSLAQIYITVEERECPYYIIHDIILDYLKGSIPKDKQSDYHKLVVQRYDDKCGGQFSTLEDDTYVFKKLLSHIIAAENFELLGTLLTQLDWLLRSVVYGDANELLACYRDFHSKVPQNFQANVLKFELFLSGHMYVLANSPKRDDILQLALLQPNESEICTQAAAIVKENKKKSWFSWSNKESDPEKYALKLKLHEEGVSECQFTADGEKVISCAGVEVKLWDSSTGMVLGNFKGHKDTVTCCAISANGRLALSSAEDNTVKVWETKTKRLVCDFRRHKYGVQCCALSPDVKWVISADIDSVIYLWDVLLGTVFKTWHLGMVSPVLTPTPEHANEPLDFSLPQRSSSQESASSSGEGVLCCNFSPDGTHFVTASQNGIIRLWNLSSYIVVLTFQGHSSQVRCCVFSKSGTRIASASLDHTAKVWNTMSGECVVSLNHSDEFAVLSCDFSQDGSRLITGDTSGSVKVWSLPHGVCLQDLPLHWDYVNCVLYSPKTQNILSAADNGIIKILWNEEIEEECEHMASAVQYHRRFSTVFVKEGPTYVPMVLCYIQKHNVLQLVKGCKAEVICDNLPTSPRLTPRCWVFSVAGDKMVVGFVQGALQLMCLKNFDGKWSASEVWTQMFAHDREVLKCSFSPDDSKIASCSYTEHKIWDAATGQHIASISGRGIGVKPCIFLADSIRIVSIQDNGVLLWHSGTGKIIKCFFHGSNQDTILCINLSKDDQRLIASTTSGLVMVWDICGELKMQSVVMPLAACARSCALSPDGSLAVAGFDDGSMKIWNVNHNKEVIQQFTGSQYWMIDVSFSPDGSKVVTLCDSIEWWNSDGQHLKRVLLKGTFGKYIRFSPDFQTFVTVDNAGLLYILTSLT